MWVDLLQQALQARPDIRTDGALCRAMLNDLAGASTTDAARYVRVLAAAVDAGVPAALQGGADGDELARRLAQEQAIEIEAARFAVTTWRAALGTEEPVAGAWQAPAVVIAGAPPAPAETTMASPMPPHPMPQGVEPVVTHTRSKAPLFVGIGLLAVLLVGGLLLLTRSGDDSTEGSADATGTDVGTTEVSSSGPDSEPASTVPATAAETTAPTTNAPETTTTAPATTAPEITTTAPPPTATVAPPPPPPPPPPITDDQLDAILGEISSSPTVLDAAGQAAQIEALATGADFPVATLDMSHTICHGYQVPGPFEGQIVIEFNREIVSSDAVSTPGGNVGLCYTEPNGFPVGSFQGYLLRGDVKSYVTTVTVGRAPVGLSFYNDLGVPVCDVGISSNLTNFYDMWTFDTPLAPDEWFQIEAALIENDVTALDCDGNEVSTLSAVPPTDKMLNLSNGSVHR